jgi:Stage II sporulation protein E (SpoIIE)
MQLVNGFQFPAPQVLSTVSVSRTRVILVRMPTVRSSLARLTAFCVSLFAICIPMCSSAAALEQPAPSAPAPFVAESLGKGAIPVDGAWQFHLGDNAAWAQPGIEDATGHDGWEEIKTDAPWGAQSHPNYAGYAWYRRHIHITTAPGASPDVDLLTPAIDDIYELYWNGVRIGGLGRFPPNLNWKFLVGPQTYGLGAARDGVLAVRVLKLPPPSTDDGTGGGFEHSPHIGSPEALAKFKDSLDYHWLRENQFGFGLSTLYFLASFLSLVAWLRNRSQKLLFWLAAYTFMPVLETLFDLRLPISGNWLVFLLQSSIQLREISQWFLLLYLLQLEDSTKLIRFLRIVAWINVIAGSLDGGLGFLLSSLPASTFVALDAVLTAIIVPAEILPTILVLIALYRRKRLDSARWLVAILAFSAAIWYAISNVADQGTRFTHWTLGAKMGAPLFALFGSSFSVQTILRTLLFASIIYAVLRYEADHRRRQAALEQEYQNARELQQILVPETLPEIPGFRLTSAYKPAQEVGGDFFQIIPLGPLHGEPLGSTIIVLGDVSGKGLKAAMTVSLIVGAIRTLVETTTSPAQILAGINRRLNGRLHGGFATCIALRLDPDGRCTLATAGHPAPFLNRREIELPGALPLGILPDTVYQEFPRQLQPGDHLALYTDGLLEARSASGELYGFDRLTILFGNQSSAEQASAEAVAFGQDDDITVLTLTCIGTGNRAFGGLAKPALGMA